MAASGEGRCEAGASRELSLDASAGLRISPAARKAPPSELVALAEQVEKVSEGASAHAQSSILLIVLLGMCRVLS